MKYIFITGGVVSGLGKGITAASLGRLLKARGLKVISQKLDPYINVDPGTMSPYQHGEVFVTEDGAETDLDLGHYERFIDEDLNKFSNITTGKVYWNVLTKERRGEFLGETVQIIPHITNEIKRIIYSVGERSGAEIVITEIGGTVGDIESQPFIEALRQVQLEHNKEDTLFIHVTLVPFIPGSNEFKSKPTQHSVRELQANGITPDIIVARCDGDLPDEIKDKIALFCNVKPGYVLENRTVSSLYEAPIMLEKQHLSSIVCKELNIDAPVIDLQEWNETIEKIKSCDKTIKVGIVGKYVKLHDAYLSVTESLKHGGFDCGTNIDIKWVDAEDLTEDNLDEILGDVGGICVPGGFGERGIEGKILAAKYARENNVPYFGICLGMQTATIEFARNVLGYEDANSTEFNLDTPYKIVDLMDCQEGEEIIGGTMRLGAYPCVLKEDSLIYKAYGTSEISERHRHRYALNPKFKDDFNEKGFEIVGTSLDGKIIEAVENKNCDFFLGVQFHPEFKSRPNRSHPLFKMFIEKITKIK